jgi:inhibitor of cysteine peptidase
LAPGETLIIRLQENPTTGYRWTVESNAGMRLDDDSFSRTGTGVGGGGSRRLQWTAQAPGTHSITLLLRRPWEAADTAIGRFSLTVVSS